MMRTREYWHPNIKDFRPVPYQRPSTARVPLPFETKVERGHWYWDKSLEMLVSYSDRSQTTSDGPQIIRDIEPYQSTITREWITGRKQHRDHLRAYNKEEVGNEKIGPAKPKPLPPVAPDLRVALQMSSEQHREVRRRHGLPE
ncbi:MAG: hypothetical protein AB7I33_12015 [Gemmatimonadales bacterium]